VERRPPPATLHGVVFDILAARACGGEFPTVTRAYAGKKTVKRFSLATNPERVCAEIMRKHRAEA